MGDFSRFQKGTAGMYEPNWLDILVGGTLGGLVAAVWVAIIVDAVQRIRDWKNQ